MPRLFTGIEIPWSIGERLALMRSTLDGARWVEPSEYHITIRFFGDMDIHRARDLVAALETAPRIQPFQLQLAGLGSFGGGEPRAIFVKVRGGEELEALQKSHERIARRHGFPPEPRKFTPHVTLARLRGTSPETVARYLDFYGGFFCEPFRVGKISLLSSRSGSGGGPYVVEDEFPLDDISGDALADWSVA
jgi:2'-5' RNA ligase